MTYGHVTTLWSVRCDAVTKNWVLARPFYERGELWNVCTGAMESFGYFFNNEHVTVRTILPLYLHLTRGAPCFIQQRFSEI